jgi:ABC-type Zn uptake system ZnuABC Zn-binding protein ZnuA
MAVHLENEGAEVEQHGLTAAAEDPQPPAHRTPLDEIRLHQARRLEEARDRTMAGIIARMSRLAASACLAAIAALAGGCGSDRASRGEGTIEVAATIAPVADIVHNAGGRRVAVTTIVPRTADPHEWRPDASARAALRAADLVVWTGGALDRWAVAGAPRRELGLLPLVDPLGKDSHWWQDPVRVERAAKEIRNELARADVHGAGYYEAATADFLERLRGLHSDMKTCLGLLGRRLQRLATQHDGFRYFNDRYRTAIVGPKGRGAEVGRRLWADTLGSPGAPTGSYLGAMSVNTTTIVEALSHGEKTCRPEP